MRRAASVWDRFYRYHESPWRGERPVAELLPLLGAGPVLELGCGNGKTAKPLAAAGVDVVALDVSWHILSRLNGIACILADASALPFSDASFSAVLDLHCTGHLDAAPRAVAMRESARVVRPGGFVVVERLGPDDLRGSQGKPVEGEPGMREVSDGRRTQFTSAAELAAEGEAAGLRLLGGVVERFQPGHRGKLVQRESVRAVLTRPA